MPDVEVSRPARLFAQVRWNDGLGLWQHSRWTRDVEDQHSQHELTIGIAVVVKDVAITGFMLPFELPLEVLVASGFGPNSFKDFRHCRTAVKN